MTADQFITALAKTGFTQVGFARHLGLSDRNVRRWVKGDWPVPATISALLKLMIKTGTKAEDLQV